MSDTGNCLSIKVRIGNGLRSVSVFDIAEFISFVFFKKILGEKLKKMTSEYYEIDAEIEMGMDVIISVWR